MAYRLLHTEAARRDLEGIVDYIVNDLCNPQAAALLLDGIGQAYAHLEETPFMYASCRQNILSVAGYRRVLVRGYLMIYRVNEAQKTVYIERFFSDMEDYARKL